MLEENHDLAHELPEYKEAIHNLKMSDNHFKKLFDEYDDVNKEVLRIEKGVDAASDERLEELKKQRLALKDEMLEMLQSAAA
jgi:hypothetical protein